MARHGGTEIDRALEVVVSEINSLAERRDGGPGVVLTVGGLVIGGTIIPDWQRFDEVEHAARAAFTVHTGGSIDDEHGGWARLLRGVSESLMRDREEHRAAQHAIGGLSESYRRLLAREHRTTHIHLMPGCSLPASARRPRADALAGTAVRGPGVVLRTPRRAVTALSSTTAAPA
jgi:hypothetical protein